MSAEPSAPSPDALTVSDLELAYRVRGHDRQVLRKLSFRIGRGESYGLVGESGCGKSTAALATVRYLPRNGRIRGGQILVDGRDLFKLSDSDLRQLRASGYEPKSVREELRLNLEQRLARWLLMTQDRVDSEYLPITHDFLATMLGTNRSSVSLAAGILQREKSIEYSHGAVTIVNRKRLEESACECYDIMQQYNGQLGLE